MHQSFLRHRDFLWAKVALALCALSSLAYLAHRPADPPNGGTWLGYLLGSLGAGLIGWLLWFGVRKRQYRSDAGTVADWLSAHVYLGASLLLIASLHCGFQFGWNVHTLAYVLMALVILSGFYGVYVYVRYPAMVTANRAGQGREAMLAEIAELDEASLALADQVGREAHAVVLNAIERTVIGGGIWDQLTGGRRRPGSDVGVRLQAIAQELQRREPASGAGLEGIKDFQATAITFLAAQVKAGEGSAERLARVQSLVELIGRRRALVDRLQRDVAYHARMEVWLFLHVPLSLGLLGALIAHVVSVFFYW